MDRKYWFWINNIPRIGNIKIRKILKAFGDDPEAAAHAGDKELGCIGGLMQADIAAIMDLNLRKRLFEEYDRRTEDGNKMVFPFEDEYPSRLKEIYDRPNVIYYKGRLPVDDIKSVAVVGSRNCSEYGRSVAMELGRVLASAGAQVISGLALGIDVAAHQGAVLAGGLTFAVLAGGVDLCYPKQNFNTYVDIIRNGGIISEFPDNTPTRPGMFPLRNRIISGLCDAVIIVEAGIKSGSLITAAQALEQNRQVYAVPGRISDGDSEGCNHLIWQGAQIVYSYDELLAELNLNISEGTKINEKNILLASDEKMLYSQLLDFGPKSLETLIKETNMSQMQVFQALLALELKGLIKEISKNFYIRII
ncbi:MAG: DNA-processing protein DprA [Lachnospiraceae bacterium]|nr:DNA-processing protein DprA [Lachnospiraceae bacterium]